MAFSCLTTNAFTKDGTKPCFPIFTMAMAYCMFLQDILIHSFFLFHIVYVRSSLGKRAFSVIGPRLWNSLPPDTRKSSTLPIFCSKLKTHFFKIAFSPYALSHLHWLSTRILILAILIVYLIEWHYRGIEVHYYNYYFLLQVTGPKDPLKSPLSIFK